MLKAKGINLHPALRPWSEFKLEAQHYRKNINPKFELLSNGFNKDR